MIKHEKASLSPDNRFSDAPDNTVDEEKWIYQDETGDL
jgi:hypothetical protein